jgi:UDP-N-acetylbacillosamine N-acetyltransferase
MIPSEQLIILGFGGHARSIADVALATGVKKLIFIDENAKEGEHFLDFPVVRSLDPAIASMYPYMPASGDNRQRQQQVETIVQSGYQLASVIAPTATIGAGATVDSGCFIGHHAHIGPLVRIGQGCIINTSAVVEHDCLIGNYVHISVHSTIAGRSQVGNRCFIGTGATVIDKVTIGAEITVGAGGVVIDSLIEVGTYVGIPVRKVNA